MPPVPGAWCASLRLIKREKPPATVAPINAASTQEQVYLFLAGYAGTFDDCQADGTRVRGRRGSGGQPSTELEEIIPRGKKVNASN